MASPISSRARATLVPSPWQAAEQPCRWAAGRRNQLRALDSGIWSHESERTKRRYTAEEIRATTPARANKFHTLVRQIAVIAFHNPKLDLFFRGQSREHLSAKGLTTLQPSLFRDLPGKRPADTLIADRYKVLHAGTG